MYAGLYVDASKLHDGIYSRSKPCLYDEYETIDSLADKARNMKDMFGNPFVSEKYFESLKLCKLVSFELKEITNE